jgi:hypothetical protein
MLKSRGGKGLDGGYWEELACSLRVSRGSGLASVYAWKHKRPPSYSVQVAVCNRWASAEDKVELAGKQKQKQKPEGWGWNRDGWDGMETL